MFLILFFIVDIYLIVAALDDLNKGEYVMGGNKVIWLMIILFFSPIGPLLYLAWGREP